MNGCTTHLTREFLPSAKCTVSFNGSSHGTRVAVSSLRICRLAAAPFSGSKYAYFPLLVFWGFGDKITS